MSQAIDFRITFGYKATDYPYGTPEHPYHRGVDRWMPVGTPVIVNGVQIGLSGMTGWVTGPHLHIGRFIGAADTDPGEGGFSFTDAQVTELNEDDTNGKYVRVQADGASWVYLHLSQQTASVGQILKPQQGDDMATISDAELADLQAWKTKGVNYENVAIPAMQADKQTWMQRALDAEQKLANIGTGMPANAQDAADAAKFRAVKEALGV